MSFRTTVLTAVVALSLLLTLAIVGLSLYGTPTRTQLAITTIVSVISPTIVALVALLKIEQVDKKIDNGKGDTNGNAQSKPESKPEAEKPAK